jgi:dTDP-4-amino-4,6-dideoxy-D-galactose acyltransferase
VVLEILEWDSEFFGIKAARINTPDLTEPELRTVLARLVAEGVRLVYWPAHNQCDDKAIGRLGGCLVDTKTTFVIDFRALDLAAFLSTSIVEAYIPSMPAADLERLAIQSGAYSRFAVDPQFPREKFLALYSIWIARSLNREIATEVLVIREGAAVVGMVTLGEKNGRGDIGLIAVDERCRGRKYGETLVRAAQQWFIAQGYALGQVVTQGENRPACALYVKCGYTIDKIEYYYHFWL